jgi:hypothetical protein
MNRAASIDALLKKTNAIFSDLKRAYEASLHEKNIREDLKVDIKNIFENLRSCLDYLAHDIFEVCCASSQKPDRLYFPIRSSLSEFHQATSKDYPGLQGTCSSVYDVLESMQPYNDPWLGHFNQLNNKNKHQDLVEQTRTEARRTTVSNSGGSVSWGSGVTFGSGVSIMGVPIDPRTQLPVSNNQVKTEVVIWIDFRFKDNDRSVLSFIEESIKNVKQIFHNIQKYI